MIHTAEGLTESEELRAAELGPPAVLSSVPYSDLIREAGLDPTQLTDVTAGFLKTVQTILSSREKYRRALLETCGPDAHEEEQEMLEKLQEEIQTGVLRRSLFVAAQAH